MNQSIVNRDSRPARRLRVSLGLASLVALLALAVTLALPRAVMADETDAGADADTAPAARPMDPLVDLEDPWAALGSRRHDVREAGRVALIEAADAANEATYIAKLGSANARVRGLAAMLLGRVGGDAAVAALMALLEDDAAAVGEQVYRALTLLGVRGHDEAVRTHAQAFAEEATYPEALDRLLFALDLRRILRDLRAYATPRNEFGRRFPGMYRDIVAGFVASGSAIAADGDADADAAGDANEGTDANGADAIAAPSDAVALLCRFIEDDSLTDIDLAGDWTQSRAQLTAVQALSDTGDSSAIPALKRLLGRVEDRGSYYFGGGGIVIWRGGRLVQYDDSGERLSMAIRLALFRLGEKSVLLSWFLDQENFLDQSASLYTAMPLYAAYIEVHDFDRALRCLKIITEFPLETTGGLFNVIGDAHYDLAALLARQLDDPAPDGLIRLDALEYDEADLASASRRNRGRIFFGGWWGETPVKPLALEDIHWPDEQDALRELVIEHLEAAFENGFRDDAALALDVRFDSLRDDPELEAMRATLRALYPPHDTDEAYDPLEMWD